MRLFHGGVPGMRSGDLIRPGHDRREHDGCPWCAARSEGVAGPGALDPPSARQDRVYLTTSRLYARFYASLYGRGDLYQVEPVGDLEQSLEDFGAAEAWCAPAARVLVALDRAVLLTWGERRRIAREWGSREWMGSQWAG